MNKFVIFSCMNLEENEGSKYKGPVVILANAIDPSFMLFFPISQSNADIITGVLNDKKMDFDADTSILGIYRTMLDSWKAGDRFLSGIVIDTIYDESTEKEMPLIRLILSDRGGMIDSLVRVNFIHAILLAAMEKVDVIISDRLMEIMMPDSEDASGRSFTSTDEDGDVEIDDNFPEDQNIIRIAGQILEQKIKDNGQSKNSEKTKKKK